MLTKKHFVLQLEVFPKSQFLKFYTLKLNGVEEYYLPLRDLIPITKYDYYAVSYACFMKQNNCIDLDMIYANNQTKEMFFFDKQGEWLDQGVYHDALSMENTYNETMWYDEFNVTNA
mmetsp:Transcript_2609/g.4368  ORF Transcript_2609/g.4368 Transcript_2609/m.4368 type:complete len:117 (-) Transcript_2609:37-387(-)